MNRKCLALDLKDDPTLIANYEEYHRNVWPEILDSLRNSGVTHMEIYRISNRFFMIIETTDIFLLRKRPKWMPIIHGFKTGKFLCGIINKPCK